MRQGAAQAQTLGHLLHDEVEDREVVLARNDDARAVWGLLNS